MLASLVHISILKLPTERVAFKRSLQGFVKPTIIFENFFSSCFIQMSLASSLDVKNLKVCLFLVHSEGVAQLVE